MRDTEFLMLGNFSTCANSALSEGLAWERLTLYERHIYRGENMEIHGISGISNFVGVGGYR